MQQPSILRKTRKLCSVFRDFVSPAKSRLLINITRSIEHAVLKVPLQGAMDSKTPFDTYNRSNIMPGVGARDLARIQWVGDSRAVLAGFPKPVRTAFGIALFEVQQGKIPLMPARRMASLGPGVFELKDSDERTWYRVIYLSAVGDVIYVLHCFEKSSRRTSKRDLRVAAKRLSRIRRSIEEQHGKEKRP